MTTTLQSKGCDHFPIHDAVCRPSRKGWDISSPGFDSRDLRASLGILSLVALFRMRSDAHHLQFAQQRALGRYVSDEFAAHRAGSITACFAPSPNAMTYVVGGGIALFFSLNRLRFANPAASFDLSHCETLTTWRNALSRSAIVRLSYR
jgi:hypothetical protein